jgi:hypothetical protein
MVWCNTGQAIALASIPVAAGAGVLTFTQLASVALVVALLTVIFDAAYQSYGPSLVRGEQLVDANGKLGVSYSLATIVGQSAAGALVTLIGSARTVVVDVISYLVSAVSLLSIRTAEPEPPQEVRRMRGEIADGLRYVFGDPLMRAVVIANALASMAIGGVSALWLVYVYRELHWSAAAAGLCLGIGAAGGVLGGLVSGRLAGRLGLPLLMLISAPAYALDLVLTLLAGPGPGGQVLVTCGYFITMTGEVVYMTANRSFRQLVCPPHLMGRMNATARWLAFGPKPVVALLFGLLATWLGLRAALVAGVVVFALPAIVLIASPLRSAATVPESAAVPE